MKFEVPEMNVVMFDVEDVLTTSTTPTPQPTDCPTRLPDEDL